MVNERRGLPPRRGRPSFPTTQWSLVLAAGDRQHSGSREALATLYRNYWYPIYAYIRRRGYDADRARDLAQDFFTALLEKESLQAADPQRGRFRSFLLGSLKNYLANTWDRESAQKRGGGVPTISVDFSDAEDRYLKEPVDEKTPESIFERNWALTQLETTLQRLRAELDTSGSGSRFELLKPCLTGEARQNLSYREIGLRLNMSESAVKVAVYRMRRRFAELLREEVGQTIEDPQQVDTEIRTLFAAPE